MKKLLAMVLAVAMILSLAAFASAEDMAVAMITDYGDITDQSFNQTTYEACKAFCEANNISFSYYKPASDADAERIASIEQAIDDGYTVIVMPGYAFGPAIAATVNEYPEVTFIGLDVSQYDLGVDFVMPANLYCAIYQEELCGYAAGYAAVKLGYSHVGFLGGMAVPAVVRYGYGFVQGVNAAAEADGKTDVVVEYVYGNQFYGDADITAYMDNWYKTLGVECVFACGGGIFTSAAEAAAKVGGKVIGVDVDQSGIIDGMYGEGMTVTSAMKGLAATVNTLLTKVSAGEFAGAYETLGIISDDPAANYVGIPETTQFSDAFTYEDYAAMIVAMNAGELVVSNDITVTPASFATVITVNDAGSVK